MDTNLIIQYTLVGISLLAILIWMLRKIFLAKKKGIRQSCCGCALSESCAKKAIPSEDAGKDCE